MPVRPSVTLDELHCRDLRQSSSLHKCRSHLGFSLGCAKSSWCFLRYGLYPNQPSPVRKAWGLAVWVSRMMLKPSP